MTPRTFRYVAYGTCVIFAVTTLALAIHSGIEGKDLWANLFASAIEVCFTVLFIEVLLERDRARRTRPARAAAFREALKVYSKGCSLWLGMIRAAYDPSRDRDFLENKQTILDEEFENITSQLDLSKEAPIRPKMNWAQYLRHSTEEIEKDISNCLQRYASYMEPDLIFSLQNLEWCPFINIAKIIPTNAPQGSEFPIINNWPILGFGENDFIKSLTSLGNELEKSISEFRLLLPERTAVWTDFHDVLEQLRATTQNNGS